MRKTQVPAWLLAMTFTGREEDDPYERDETGAIVEEDGEKVLKDGWEYDEEDKPKKSEASAEDEGDSLEKKLADTEETLRKERALRRKAERDAKRAKKGAPKEKSQEEKDAESEALAAERAKNAKLAAGLLQTKVDAAILAEARKQGFIDPTDALTEMVRKDVDADQADDDPTDIDIDSESVEDAVKALAKKKKHLLGQPKKDDDDEGQGRSGGRFRRKAGEPDESPTEQKLKGTYPSLSN